MMIKYGTTTVALMLLLGTVAFAEPGFVSIADMDEVFESYCKEGKGQWRAVAPEVKKTKKSGAGNVSASKPGINSRESAEKAFDGDSRTKYCTSAPTIWLKYRCDGGKRKVLKYSLTAANDYPARDPKDWTLEGSNNGKQWTVLDQRAGESFTARFQRREFTVKTPGDYSWYKLDVTKNQGTNTTQLAELELLPAVQTKQKPAPKKPKPAPKAAQAKPGGWTSLFEPGGFDMNKHWELKDGILSSSKTPGGILWSKKQYTDFEITVDYRTSKECNSGLFFRSDPKNPVQGGFEIQIASDGIYSGRHVVGSLFDAKAPTKQEGKPDGEWNTMVLTCRGPKSKVVLNGEQVLEFNIDDWTTPRRNPDGSPNKFKTALKDLPRTGHIGLQYHGQPISFRNIKIRPLGN